MLDGTERRQRWVRRHGAINEHGDWDTSHPLKSGRCFQSELFNFKKAAGAKLISKLESVKLNLKHSTEGAPRRAHTYTPSKLQENLNLGEFSRDLTGFSGGCPNCVAER